MMKKLIILLMIGLPALSIAQTKKEAGIEKGISNIKIDNEAALIKKLSGVEYAIIPLSKDQEKYLLSNPAAKNDLETYSAFASFLKKRFNIKEVALTEKQRDQVYKLAKSSCDIVYTNVQLGEFKRQLGAIGVIRGNKISFTFCDSSSYVLDIDDIGVNGLTVWSQRIKREFHEIRLPEVEHDSNNTLSLPHLPYIISKDSLKTLCDEKDMNFEGIYQSLGNDEIAPGTNLGIIKIKDSIDVVYLGGDNHAIDWKEGELKGVLTPTKSNKIFFGQFYNSLKWREPEKESLIFDNDFNSFTLKYPDMSIKFVRIY